MLNTLQSAGPGDPTRCLSSWVALAGSELPPAFVLPSVHWGNGETSVLLATEISHTKSLHRAGTRSDGRQWAMRVLRAAVSVGRGFSWFITGPGEGDLAEGPFRAPEAGREGNQEKGRHCARSHPWDPATALGWA